MIAYEITLFLSCLLPLSCEEKPLIYDEEWQEKRKENPHTAKESRGIAWGVGICVLTSFAFHHYQSFALNNVPSLNLYCNNPFDLLQTMEITGLSFLND